MFSVPSVRPSLSAVVHVIREDGAPPSSLEKSLAENVANAAPPRWPISPVEKHVVDLTTRRKYFSVSPGYRRLRSRNVLLSLP
jgi:hypothetical protein